MSRSNIKVTTSNLFGSILDKEHTNKRDLHNGSFKKAQSYGHVRFRHHAQYNVAWDGQACETLDCARSEAFALLVII